MIRQALRIDYRIILPMILLLSVSCRHTAIHSRTAEPTNIVREEQEARLTIPTDTLDVAFTGLNQKRAVFQYYATYGNDPVWMTKNFLNADSMRAIIRKTPYYGLSQSTYHLAELDMLARASANARTIRAELLLTDAFLTLAGDLKYGVKNTIQKQNEDTARIHLLHRVATYGNLKQTLEYQEPVHAGYQRLKKGLGQLLDNKERHLLDSALLSAQIRLVSINMERWRREITEYGQRYIFINIPSYMLEVVDQDSVILSSRIIVGRPQTQTPVLSSIVQCISIYPYWHVPRKISVEEYLPILKKDTTFLRRNNFDVLDRRGKVLNADSIPWNKFTVDYFPVVLRQRQGVENSLGIIKFIFDNPYAVFLHDTNAKRLFTSTGRAFSHGCIRMEQALQLAHYLVTGSVNVESRIIGQYVRKKQQRWIELKNPISIYTRYFTCDFRDGVLNVYKDIYGKDDELYNLLYSRTTPLDL